MITCLSCVRLPPSFLFLLPRGEPHHEGKSDQAYGHGAGSCRPHDRMAELGHADGGSRRHPGSPHHDPGAGKGAAAGERCLQWPQWRGEGGSFHSRLEAHTQRRTGAPQSLLTVISRIMCSSPHFLGFMPVIQPIKFHAGPHNDPGSSSEFWPQASCSSLRSRRQHSWPGHRWMERVRGRAQTRAAWPTWARSTRRASPVEVKDYKHGWGSECLGI